MDYDPIKDKLGALIDRHPLLHRAFFAVLDTLFLRSWYVRRELRRILDAWQDEPVRILDAGTGFGQYAHFMARNYPAASVTAVDVKEDYLDRARRFFQREGFSDRVHFAQNDLTDLKVEGPFDLILSVDVMEHIEEDEKVFEHFNRVLAPGGTVIINTPSNRGGSGVEEAGDESFIGEHVRDGYDADELAEKLQGAGLQPVRSLYTYGEEGSRAWRLLIQRPMKMIGISWTTLPAVAAYYAVALPLGLWLNARDMKRPNQEGTGLLMVAQKPRK